MGCDRRELGAYDVARFPLERRATIPVEITPKKVEEVDARGLYWRGGGPAATRTLWTVLLGLLPVFETTKNIIL